MTQTERIERLERLLRRAIEAEELRRSGMYRQATAMQNEILEALDSPAAESSGPLNIGERARELGLTDDAPSPVMSRDEFVAAMAVCARRDHRGPALLRHDEGLRRQLAAAEAERAKAFKESCDANNAANEAEDEAHRLKAKLDEARHVIAEHIDGNCGGASAPLDALLAGEKVPPC